METKLFESLSPEMRAYFISQTDPFHDNPYRLEGAPSDLNSQSVVMCVNTEFTYNASSFGLPTGVGDKWDMHIAMLPISTATPVNGVQNNLVGSFRNGVNAFVNNIVFYPLTICGVPAGGTTYKWTASPLTNVLQYQGLPNDYPSNLVRQASGGFGGRTFREIGRSFEVVDQTAQLYRQGSVTVYEFPSECIDRMATYSPIANSATTTVTNNRTSTYLRMPATSVAQATRVPGSKTWDASHGVYCTGRKTVEQIPFSTGSDQAVVFLGDPQAETISNTTTYNSFVSLSARTQASVVNGQSTSVAPYGSYGAYFTGLSSEYGTYRIRFKQFFEILAAPSDYDILPLMSPTVPRNPEAEWLISQTLAKLPCFVPQTMNPKGEAWRKVVKAAGNVLVTLSPLAASVPGLEKTLKLGGEAAIHASNIGAKKKVQGHPKAKPKAKASGASATTAS